MLYIIAVLLLVIVALQLNAAMIQANHGKFFVEASALLVDRVERVEQAIRDVQVPGQKNVVDRLERIEVAVDPTARARHDVARVLRELDDALEEDDYLGYADHKVRDIQQQIEQGERPEREAWDTWVRTPYPWS